jgi:hypothetical protein
MLKSFLTTPVNGTYSTYASPSDHVLRWHFIWNTFQASSMLPQKSCWRGLFAFFHNPLVYLQIRGRDSLTMIPYPFELGVVFLLWTLTWYMNINRDHCLSWSNTCLIDYLWFTEISCFRILCENVCWWSNHSLPWQQNYAG